MFRGFGYARILFILFGAMGLFFVYFFQHYLDFHSVFFKGQWPQELNYSTDFVEVESFPFVVNKVGRYLLNDLFTIAIIYGLFYEKKYLRLIFLLPTYLFIYLAKPSGFSSLLSHLHRIVLNPVLMMLLIPAYFYQRRISQEKD